MKTKLISDPAAAGIDVDDVRTNPGALVEIHEDVLRDLMRTPHAIERPNLSERADAAHPRRRLCI